MRPAGNSRWVLIYGDDSFVINAFTYARKYAPANCKLFLNDYNEYMPAKTNDIVNIANKLKQLRVVDGIGMQSHLDIVYPNSQVYNIALEKFLSTGLEVQITELDITSNNEEAQALIYKEIFSITLKHADQILAVTLWGAHDNNSWRRNQNPLVFGDNYSPKKAYQSILELVCDNFI